MHAAGLARYGYKDAVVRMPEGRFYVTRFMDLPHMPAVLLGRHHDEAPALYVRACRSSALASGSVSVIAVLSWSDDQGRRASRHSLCLPQVTDVFERVAH